MKYLELHKLSTSTLKLYVSSMKYILNFFLLQSLSLTNTMMEALIYYHTTFLIGFHMICTILLEIIITVILGIVVIAVLVVFTNGP